MSRAKQQCEAECHRRWPPQNVPEQADVNAKLLVEDDIRAAIFRRETAVAIRDRCGTAFDKLYGRIGDKIAALIAEIDEELCRLKAELDRLRALDKCTDDTVPDAVVAPVRRLTGVERLQLSLYVIMMLLILSLGCVVVNNAIQVAYPKEYGTLLMVGFFAIPLLSPVLFEILEGYCQTDVGKRRYAVAITLLAILGCSLWTIQFSISSSALFIGGQSFGWTDQGAEKSWFELAIFWADKFALFIQLISEGLLMAVLWLNTKRILKARWGLAAAINAEKTIRRTQIAELIEHIEALTEHRAVLSGQQDNLKDRRHVLCETAAQMLEGMINLLPGGRRA